MDMQTNRRSPRFSGSGETGGKVISPDGAADGLNGTGGTGSGIGSGNGGEVPPTVNAGGPPLPDSPQRQGKGEGGGNGGNGGSEKQKGEIGRRKTSAPNTPERNQRRKPQSSPDKTPSSQRRHGKGARVGNSPATHRSQKAAENIARVGTSAMEGDLTRDASADMEVDDTEKGAPTDDETPETSAAEEDRLHPWSNPKLFLSRMVELKTETLTLEEQLDQIEVHDVLDYDGDDIDEADLLQRSARTRGYQRPCGIGSAVEAGSRPLNSSSPP